MWNRAMGVMLAGAAAIWAQDAAPAAQSGAGPDVAAKASPKIYLVKVGTKIPLSMINSVSTKNSVPGDRVYLETVFPILVNGKIVIPPGSYVAGTITKIQRPGKVKGRGEFYLRFDSLTLPNGVTRDFRARVSTLDGRASEELDRNEGAIKSEGNKGEDAHHRRGYGRGRERGRLGRRRCRVGAEGCGNRRRRRSRSRARGRVVYARPGRRAGERHHRGNGPGPHHPIRRQRTGFLQRHAAPQHRRRQRASAWPEIAIGHSPLAALISAGVGVRLEGVRRVFDDRIVLSNFHLSISPGEFLAILGPSGCGKSTLLRMIARLAPPDAGSIAFTPSENFQTAFVFQDAHLLPWRTVLENAALPLELTGVAREQRRQKARKALEQVNLAEALALYPAQLSGGMRMRVSLARALVTGPRLLLLDEPFAALDELTRFHLDVQLRRLWQASGMTVIFVTHSISEAAFLAERAVVLARREGRIKLDRRLELPGERTNELRGDARFAEESKLLLDQMEEQ